MEGLKVGDRVAVEAGVPCGQCEFCRIGRYNACPEVVFFSTPPYHGTLTRFHLHPATWVHKIPDSISFEEGSLLEPLAVALAGIERAELKLGDPLLICGAGPIGLVSLLAARAAGATPIVISDIAQSRLDFAKKLVPGVKTVLVERGVDAKGLGEKIKQEAGLPGGLFVALECTGVESSIQAAVFSMRFGGTVFVRRSNVLACRPEAAALTPLLLLAGHRRWQGLPVAAFHAHERQRDRSEATVPLRQPVPKGKLSRPSLSCRLGADATPSGHSSRGGGFDRPQAAGYPPLHSRDRCRGL